MDTAQAPAASPEPINVSALNQYGYCPRRFALIYMEAQFADNVHTARGNAEHDRVDSLVHTTSKEGARVEYGLSVWSERLGLIGKCDVVEFWPDGTVYPVEYKHGPRRQRDNDDFQLAAQAMCLEEVLGRPVHSGAIYHASSRRRREVTFTAQLRTQVETALGAMRKILAGSRLPPVIAEVGRCRECSMHEICQPGVGRANAKLAQTREWLFDPNA